MPGYFLSDFDLAHEIVAAVDAPNLRLQFDIFHAAKITGDVLGTWDRVRDITAHIQVAQITDRGEPDQGAFDYPAFFAQLDAEGYAGFVSGEYRPRGTTAEGLGWIAAE